LRRKWSQGTGTLNDIGSVLKRDPKTNILEGKGYWEGESQRTLRRSKEKRDRGKAHKKFGGATTLGLENQVRLKASLYDTSKLIYY